MSDPFSLSFNPLGQLTVELPDGMLHEAAVAVRAFPIAAPQESVSILSAEGKELLWIDNLANVSASNQKVIEKALQMREFMPEILRLDSVNSFSTPCTWRVQTSRGSTEFVLKGEEDIKRLSGHTLIVVDAHGVQFLIRHLPSLDRHTRKLLDRFL
ncbi:MAG: DUF1854 domain-containing protein [Burkholderiales bacterium]|jgi:hypothetical protein|nr:DUF1854 domain-containing protein [Burkholderiales bacterium]